jgi:hypothetical protein
MVKLYLKPCRKKTSNFNRLALCCFFNGLSGGGTFDRAPWPALEAHCASKHLARVGVYCAGVSTFKRKRLHNWRRLFLTCSMISTGYKARLKACLGRYLPTLGDHSRRWRRVCALGVPLALFGDLVRPCTSIGSFWACKLSCYPYGFCPTLAHLDG